MSRIQGRRFLGPVIVLVVAAMFGTLLVVSAGWLTKPSERLPVTAAAAGAPTSIVPDPPAPDPAPVIVRAVAPAPRPGTAQAVLATLTVRDRAALTGFKRSLFGPEDLDTDHNGCDTRNDVLRRDLTGFTLAGRSNGCAVVRGTLRDPYTGRTIGYHRGRGTAAAVAIDEAVTLRDAWRSGAQQWSQAKRAQFANDSLNLLAVDGPTAAKRAAAASWVVPNTAFRCAFAARQIAVKARYGLTVTAGERATLAHVLATCPNQPLPVAQPFRLGGGPSESTGPSPAVLQARLVARAKARAKAVARAKARAARAKARAAARAKARAARAARAAAKARARAAAARLRAANKAKWAAQAKARKAIALAKAKARAAAKAKRQAEAQARAVLRAKAKAAALAKAREAAAKAAQTPSGTTSPTTLPVLPS
ncbi:MAG TPA: HNH endonuclease family protein [Intrasporangium sp.]|uniref:HNH endonuclease family protein n=1 Tax=Intrasporangium sp. TaxID=1925024 RepID=UPI002D77B02D|nr:HNH endonuclease family protein [Intrasporangium sp.]HET7398188.1 HNH endonuclease family protein [Intrasporangium sp.]